MKKLSRIILINWYLIEATEWEIEGHVALLGKNGSGKSSFIDALQYVLLGGNKTDWHPNAKATDRRRTRDVRSYVLGLVKDEEAVASATSYQPRPDALCRIVLVFKDEESGEGTTIGAALSARTNDPQETVEGFFIAEGCDLRVGDFLDVVDDGVVPRSYRAIQEFLRHRAAGEPLYFFGHQPKHFVDQLLRSLGPNERPPALEKFRRSFKQSINLSGLVGSVSDFVRNSILDSKPINLEQMRQSVTSWRSKQAAVARMKDQIERLEVILDSMRRAQKAGQRRAGYLWCAAELRFISTDAQREELTGALVDQAAAYRGLRRQKRQLDEEIRRLEDKLQEIRRVLDQDQAEATRLRLIERRDHEQRDVEYVQRSLSMTRSKLEGVAQLMTLAQHLTAQENGLLNSLSQLTQDLCGAWPEEPAAVDAAVAAVQGCLPPMVDRAESERNQILLKTEETKQTVASYSIKLDQLKEGGKPLKDNTRALVAALAERGIEAVPVCDVVEVTDPSWQPAIEAYLRSNMEALIVRPDQAQDAVEIYRRLKRSTKAFGATVVNTRKVQEWPETYDPGTAPVLIEGDDPLAVKYLRHLLRNIRLSDLGTGDLIKEKRAVAKDGMFVSDAGIKRLALPEFPTLGRGALEQQVAYYEKATQVLIQQLTHSNLRYQQFKSLYDEASKLSQRLGEFSPVSPLVRRLIATRKTIASIEEQINAIDTSHLDVLRTKAKGLAERRQQAHNRSTRASEAIGGARKEFRVNNAERHALDQKLPMLALDRRKHTEDDDYTADRASELLEQLEQEATSGSAEEYAALVRKSEERAKDAEERQRRQDLNARDGLHEYLSTYPTDGFAMAPVTSAGDRARIELLLHDLKEVGLHEREKDVADALFQVQRVIRSDLAIRLRSNLGEMRRRFDELNAELRRRPFSANQIYQFHYAQRAEYAEFLRFVENVDEHLAADVGSLFDSHTHINEQVEEMLSGEGGERLADYREYYGFDIEIRDTDAGISEMLSKRIGAASGGEHKTPFYVAMGASLASAYRLETRPEEGIDGGVSLYLADEAFEKMDWHNTVQAANYLKSIGLQMFIAAPDDAESKLRTVVDTVLWFIREGDSAYVEADYVRPAAKAMLKTAFDTKRDLSKTSNG